MGSSSSSRPEGALHRRRGIGLATGALPGSGGRGYAWVSGLRRCRFHESATADHPLDCRRRSQKAGFGSRKHYGHKPQRKRTQVRNTPDQRQRGGDISRVRHHRRWHRQLPDALPGERCLRAHRQAKRLWFHLSLRRAGQRLRYAGWSVLPLLISRTAAAGHGALVRRRRCAGHSAGAGRSDSGDGDDQADTGLRRDAGWAPVADRCPGHAFSRAKAAQESRVSGMR